MVCICFALLSQLQRLSVRWRTEGCSALYGHRDQGNVLHICWVNNSKDVHQNWAVGSFQSIRLELYLPLKKMLKKKNYSKEMTNNHLHPPSLHSQHSSCLLMLCFVVFSSPLAVFRCALPGLGRDVRGRHGSWQEQRRCQQLHQAAVLPQTQPSRHCRYLGRGEMKSPCFFSRLP